jgi:sulfate adenylyltransferase
VGRDHASPGSDSAGKPFYGPYDAQELAERLRPEHGVGVLPFGEMMYLLDEDRDEEVSRIPREARTASISGTQVRDEFLNAGRRLPEWFTRPEVGQILMETYPPRHRQGVCVWFTGLSGAGKSTTAEILTVLLLERGRQATVLDGDARRGEITGFTGIDDPYEAPEHPELTLDTVVTTPEDNARRVLAHLERAGFVR